MLRTRAAVGLVTLALAIGGCSGATHGAAPEPSAVAPDGLDGLLLKAPEVDTIMGTTGITAQPVSSDMNDHRDLVTNLNCLGVWQSDEAAVYENSGSNGVRRQTLRAPDADMWDSVVVQSVLSFASSDAARNFYTQSLDRWSKCTNHRLNIGIGGQDAPSWRSGDLNKADTTLTMPVTRQSADNVRECERVLAVKANVIIDAEACTPQAVTQGGEIVNRIESKFPR
jgi:PknH-like extracellular domain